MRRVAVASGGDGNKDGREAARSTFDDQIKRRGGGRDELRREGQSVSAVAKAAAGERSEIEGGRSKQRTTRAATLHQLAATHQHKCQAESPG